MAIHAPGRHPAFPPIGRLRASPLSGGKKSGFMELNLTAMVDMFTVIVIFLLQSFSGEGEISIQKDLKLPPAVAAVPLSERGPVIVVMRGQLMLDGEILASLDKDDDAEPGIPALTDKLTKIKEASDKIEAELRRRDPSRAEKPFDGHLIVQSDLKTDFKLVRKTIFSANSAGWVHIQFVVQGEGKKSDDEGGAAPPEG
jgi:biopolymer transport protein ExbD